LWYPGPTAHRASADCNPFLIDHQGAQGATVHLHEHQPVASNALSLAKSATLFGTVNHQVHRKREVYPWLG